MLAALRERNLALLVTSGTVSAFGTGMSQVALAFAVLGIGGASDLGWVFLSREVPSVAFLLIGGVWADRVSRKQLLVGGDITLATTQAVTALAFLFHHAEVWSIACLQGAFGIANSFTRPASTGLIPQAVRSEHLQEANALIDLSRSTMRIAGPAVGAAIVVVANPAWALVADAASFAVSAFLRVRMQIAEGPRAGRTALTREVRDGWAAFIERSWLWIMVGCFGIFQLTLFPAMLVLGPVVAKSRLGGAAAWGAILASQSAGSVIGGLVALRVRPRRPLLTCCYLMLPATIFLAMLALASSLILLCGASLFAGLTLTTSGIVWMTAFQRSVPEHLVSRLSAFDWLGSVALNPLGYALIGPLAGALGTARTLYAAAALNGGATIAAALAPSIRTSTCTESEETRCEPAATAGSH